LEANPSELLDKTLMPKDLLVVEGHANPMEIGRCAMATEAVSGFAFQNHLFRLRPFSISAEFGLYWMNSHVVRNYWWRVSSSSSGLSTINRTKLNAVPVLVPNSDEQNRIRLVLDQISERVISEKLERDKLTALKSGLMDDLPTGRVRIPQAEAALEQAM
jgi:type I restriction enzyme S subunit